MPSPGLSGLHEGPTLDQLEGELRAYVKQVTRIHQAIYLQVQPKRTGPFEVTHASSIAVKVRGSDT